MKPNLKKIRQSVCSRQTDDLKTERVLKNLRTRLKKCRETRQTDGRGARRRLGVSASALCSLQDLQAGWVCLITGVEDTRGSAPLFTLLPSVCQKILTC